MALFKKLRESINQAFTEQESPLIGKGILGQGVVLGVRPGALTEFIGGTSERECTFMLEVQIEGTAAYRVDTTKRVPDAEYRKVQPGVTTYAVWVNPDDHNNVEIELPTEEP